MLVLFITYYGVPFSIFDEGLGYSDGFLVWHGICLNLFGEVIHWQKDIVPPSVHFRKWTDGLPTLYCYIGSYNVLMHLGPWSPLWSIPPNPNNTAVVVDINFFINLEEPALYFFPRSSFQNVLLPCHQEDVLTLRRSCLSGLTFISFVPCHHLSPKFTSTLHSRGVIESYCAN